MNEKLIRLFLVLIVGWAFGYFHHFSAVNPDVKALEAKVAVLEEKLMYSIATSSTVSKVHVKTTAYSNDPSSINRSRWRDSRTATNKLAQRGHVAADWRIFPPGTRLYIPGYGEAVVEDRGGAVKGYHLDLFVDSYAEARKWGVKELEVYIIEKGRPVAADYKPTKRPAA